jgi:hypothetical protein
MRLETDDESAIRSYLLGESSPQEQKQIEESLLADDDAFERLLFVEEDLVEDYLSGELSAHERERFKDHFLAAPERQQDVRFARALRKYVASSVVEKGPARGDDSLSWFSSIRSFFVPFIAARPFAGVALAVALLLLVGGGFWLFWRTQPSPSQPDLTQVQPSPPSMAQTPSELPDDRTANRNHEEMVTQANTSASEPVEKRPKNIEANANSKKQRTSVFALALTSGVVREGGEMKRVSVPLNTARVRLQLELDPAADEYESYRAALQTGSGQEVATRSGLRSKGAAHGKLIIWEIPADLLTGGDYYLKLSGLNAAGQLEAVATYGFRVIK